MQATGCGDDTETGFVEWDGTQTVIGGDEVLPGEVHTNTVLVSDLGLTDASDLRLIFDANEPHGAGQISILLEDLVLTLYSAGGDVLAEFGLAQDDILFEQPPGFGTGKSGGAFVLDAEQAATLDAVLTADARFGLAATLSMAEDGPEQFFLARALGPDEIPEPASLALLGSGLLGLGLLRRRAKAARA